jgi:polar amino acid transport system substrate-binding protein
MPATAPPTLAVTPPSTPSTTPAAGQTPTGVDCSPEDPALVHPGRLTFGLSEPAVPPWFGGDPAIAYPGEPVGTEWAVSDPYSGEGFEAAVAYAIAAQLGFSRENVLWEPIDPLTALDGGPKPFDLYVSQAVPAPPAVTNVDFSRAYYEFNYAVLGLFQNPIFEVTTLDELRSHTLGFVEGSAGQIVVSNIVQPTSPPSAFPDLAAARSALELDDIDGVVVDLPTAFRLRDEEIPGAVVVGQFEATDSQLGFVSSVPNVYAAVLPKGHGLTSCVDQALDELDAAGTLDRLRLAWLADRANAPILE